MESMYILKIGFRSRQSQGRGKISVVTIILVINYTNLGIVYDTFQIVLYFSYVRGCIINTTHIYIW